MRTITVEEHFISPAFLAGPGQAFMQRMRNSGPPGAKLVERLSNVGQQRIGEMDAAGIDMQLMSLNSPGVEQAEAVEGIAVAREANDFLAETVNSHPTRFAGFASLPIQAPDQAAEELQRCVRKLGFKGANINGHARGRYLDD